MLITFFLFRRILRPTYRTSQIGVELAESGGVSGHDQRHEDSQRQVRASLIKALENFVKENDTSERQKAILSNKGPDGRKRTWGPALEANKTEEENEQEKNKKLLDAMDDKHRDAELNRSQLNEKFGPLFEDYRTEGWATLTFVVALLLKNTIIGICVGLQQGLSVQAQSDASKSLNM